jgi:hypothetical protein
MGWGEMLRSFDVGDPVQIHGVGYPYELRSATVTAAIPLQNGVIAYHVADGLGSTQSLSAQVMHLPDESHRPGCPWCRRRSPLGL